jgi:RNA polymerase sigma-70 factor (ECF subfamily)
VGLKNKGCSGTFQCRKFQSFLYQACGLVQQEVGCEWPAEPPVQTGSDGQKTAEQILLSPGCNKPPPGASLPMKEKYRRRNLLSVLEEPAIAIPDELERIFRDYHRLVFRTAYRITSSPGDAEDVLQTVFLRLLRRGQNAEALENPEGYLRRAAINAALDVIRSRQAEHTVPLPEESSGLIQTEPARADGSDLRQALSRAIAQLKPRPAEIFTLRFLEGLSNRQIAQTLDISQVLVAVIVHRTRQQLRKELRPYLGDKS